MNLTKTILIETFLELCKKMPVEKVSINMLVEKAGVSKPTFYHHFKDKYDLIASIYMRDVMQTDKSFQYLGGIEELVIGLNSLYEKRDFYKKALAVSGQNTLHETLHNYNMNYNCQSLKAYLQTDQLSDEIMFLLKYHSYGCIGYIVEWFKEDCPVPPEEVARFQYEHMPDIIKKAWAGREG